MVRFLLSLGVFIAGLQQHQGFWSALLLAVIVWAVLTSIKWLIGMVMLIVFGTGYGVYALWKKLFGKKGADEPFPLTDTERL